MTVAASAGARLTDGAVPAVLAIDVESDTRAGRPGSGVEATGFERTHAWLSALRPRFEDATGRRVRFAWFVRMDPQIAGQAGRADGLVDAAPAAFEAIRAAGDVIGLHTHAGRWDRARERWVADHGDAAWIDRCLTASFSSFEARFGRACREHRFGDRFSSAAMYQRLSALGALVDLTAEPGARGGRSSDPALDASGAIPDYRTARKDAHRFDGSGPWILPLSSADPGPAVSVPRRWARRIAFLGRNLHRPLSFERDWPSSGRYWDLVDGVLDDGAGHLAWAIRSDVSLSPRFPAVATLVGELLRRPLASRIAFCSGEDALAALGLTSAAGRPTAVQQLEDGA